MERFFREVITSLRKGGVGVLPTDTIYGIVGSAFSEKAVARIYRLRKRNLKKQFIVLIGSISGLKKFGVVAPLLHPPLLRGEGLGGVGLWPGKVSVILPVPARKFAYLHRGTKSIAFRLPRPAALRALLKKTGPLVAPSANIEGEPPSRTIKKAKKYFGDKVDFYVDGGTRASQPSTLVRIENGKVIVLRKGACGAEIFKKMRRRGERNG